MPEIPKGDRDKFDKMGRDLVALVRSPDFNRDRTITPENEYEEARYVIAHFGGVVAIVRKCLVEDKLLIISQIEAKGSFLDGLSGVDVAKLTPQQAEEFQRIRELAGAIEWDNLDSITRLNRWCVNFKRGRQLDTPYIKRKR